MGLKLPKNQIVTSKYTIGKEYMFESTYREYQGYYYETKGKIFAGKEFNINAPVLIKINSSNVNTLLTNPNTYAYAKISNVKISSTNILSYNYIPTNDDYNKGYATRYFAKKQNTYPDIIIREISEDTFKLYKNNPNYQLISIIFNFTPGGFTKGVPQNINKAENEMPGIKTFLGL